MKKNKTYAIDFDGTLCVDMFPYIGPVNQYWVDFVLEHQKQGDKFILWTCRTKENLNKAVAWCLEKGIVFNAVNENLPEYLEAFGGDTRKVFADEYIDDKNACMCCKIRGRIT